MAQKAAITKTRTRRALLNLLKMDGALDSTQLAQHLQVSAMAVRQHLYELQAQGLVAFREETRPVGRPAKLWHLTAAADKYFPESYAELSVDLIGAISKTFGPSGFDKLLEVRLQQQTARYKTELDGAGTLKQKVKALARVRTAEGYMADVKTDVDGALLLVENHCPICAAAQICQGLCQRELDAFQAVLGDPASVKVERTEHILAGARRCAYRITPQPATSK